MKASVIKRILSEGEYIARTGATVRDTAKEFGVGKSTVHSDMVKRLNLIDKQLYKRVKTVLYINLSQRHIRGGMATREKFKKASKKS
ncbi:MAG: sporulation transcriptional regulator SpoIIID [Clostridia bacterium]|nr:sporulation transcriptional regulator SpoIIID [Clostridia bacterium]